MEMQQRSPENPSNADSKYSIHGQVICHTHAAGDKLHFCYTFQLPFFHDDML